MKNSTKENIIIYGVGGLVILGTLIAIIFQIALFFGRLRFFWSH